MTNKKSALGKGLGALIPESAIEENKKDNDLNSDNILEIDINKITPNEKQPRKTFDEEKLLQLSQSIKENGIIQPIIVQKKMSFILLSRVREDGEQQKLRDLKRFL
jgi:ParB family chromosome partitioning protein